MNKADYYLELSLEEKRKSKLHAEGKRTLGEAMEELRGQKWVPDKDKLIRLRTGIQEGKLVADDGELTHLQEFEDVAVRRTKKSFSTIGPFCRPE